MSADRSSSAAPLSEYRSKVFAVTGGADGIGFALAAQAVGLGMRAVILDCRADAANDAAARLRDSGGAATAYSCDVSDAASLRATAAHLEARGDVPAILWINAGVATLGGFLGAAESDIDWIYEVNVLGAIRTARTVVPLMLAQEGPRHVGITSSSASVVAADSVYGASKHAVLAVGEALRAELDQLGVGVTLLIPGRSRTRIWDGARARPARFGGPASLPEEFGGPWENGLDPAEVATMAFAAVAAGGGYTAVLPARETPRMEQFEARVGDIRGALEGRMPRIRLGPRGPE